VYSFIQALFIFVQIGGEGALRRFYVGCLTFAIVTISSTIGQAGANTTSASSAQKAWLRCVVGILSKQNGKSFNFPAAYDACKKFESAYEGKIRVRVTAENKNPKETAKAVIQSIKSDLQAKLKKGG
jgi:hypothetical protein